MVFVKCLLAVFIWGLKVRLMVRVRVMTLK